MQRKRVYSILCIFFILVAMPNINKVSAVTTLQTFETNPLEFWTLNNVDAVFHNNNTISFESNAAWLPTFNLRKQIFIAGDSQATANVVIQINVNRIVGTDSGKNVYLNDTCKDDYDDIQFTDDDGETLLNYWLQEDYTTSLARFWVEVKDALSSPRSIYIYYNSTIATTLSNGKSTFDFFDDFDDDSINTTLWTTVIGTPIETGGELLVEVTAFEEIRSNSQFDKNNFLITDAYIGNGGSNTGGMLGFRDNDGIVDYYEDVMIYMYQNGDGDGRTISADSSNVEQTVIDYVADYRIWTIEYDDSVANFYKDFSLLGTHSTYLPIETDQYINIASYRSNSFVRLNWIAVDEFYAGVSISSYGNEESDVIVNVEIPVSTIGDIRIKTMIEQRTFTNNESVNFSFISSLGEITNLIFIHNETYDYRIRVDFAIKKGINIYKYYVSDEFQSSIYREEVSHIISKDISIFKISFYNYTPSSRLTMFYLSGDLDYTIDTTWEITIFDDSDYATVEAYNYIEMFTQTSVTETYSIRFRREFNNFQYLRTFFNIDYRNEAATRQFYSNNLLTLRIEDYYIEFDLTTNSYDSTLYGDVRISIYPETTEYIYELISVSDYTQDTSYTLNTIKVWRTLENHLGVAVGSDSGIFHSEFDDRRLPETDFSYWISNSTLDNFNGTIQIDSAVGHENDGSGELFTSLSLAYMEYDFHADYGIAEPHFSSTWEALFPFNIINAVAGFLGGGIAALQFTLPSWITDFWDFILDFGSNLAEGIEPFFTDLYNDIVELGNAIGLSLDDLFTDISDNALIWGQDIIDWTVTALMGFVDSIAAFLYWFVDGIGLLFGINGLAQSVIDVIANFGLAIGNFVTGIVLVFSVFGAGITFIFGFVSTYLPLVLTLGAVFLIMHVGFTILTFDQKVIMDMVSFYVGLITRFLEIMYSIANMIIQFIGGIIP